MRPYILGLTLWLFWIILTSSLSVQSLLVGLLVSFLVVLFVFDKQTQLKSSFVSLAGVLRYVKFTRVLLVEIFKANIDVAKIVLSRKLDIQPQFVRIPLVVSKQSNQILLASAITLTPGTLTVDLNEDGYVIHALTDAAAKDLLNSSLVKSVQSLEKTP